MPECMPSRGFARPSIVSQEGETYSARGGEGSIRSTPHPTPTIAPGEAPATTAARPGNKLRILLVEDHAPTLAIISLLLERDGYEVITADSVTEALGCASGGRFDLLISDLSLPDGTGSDLLRQIRQNAQTFPAIAMTGYGEQEDLSATRDAGFCMHLVKPVDLPELREAIRKATTE